VRTEEQGECFIDIRCKILISGKKAIHAYDSIMIKNIQVRTLFITERAIFIHWMFSNNVLGGQWAQRATRRAGGGRRGKRAHRNHGQGADMGQKDSRLVGYSRTT
jgi:hypothetical protein